MNTENSLKFFCEGKVEERKNIYTFFSRLFKRKPSETTKQLWFITEMIFSLKSDDDNSNWFVMKIIEF